MSTETYCLRMYMGVDEKCVQLSSSRQDFIVFFFLLLFCVFLLIPSLKKKLLDNYSLTLVSLRKKNYRFKGIKNGKIIWYKEFTGIFESTVFFPRKRSNTRVYQLGCKELAIFSTLLSRGPLIFFLLNPSLPFCSLSTDSNV